MTRRYLILITALLVVGCGADDRAAMLSAPPPAKAGAQALVSNGVASFSGKYAYYTISKTASGWNVQHVSGSPTTVSLATKTLLFADMAVSLDQDGNAAKAYRVYRAAFDRPADTCGLSSWIGHLDRGMSLQTVAEHFISSAEFQSRYGANLSNAAFVDQLYRNILHRPADQAGLNYWVWILDSRTDTRAGVLANFSEGAENRQQVLASIESGIAYPIVSGTPVSLLPAKRIETRLAISSISPASIATQMFAGQYTSMSMSGTLSGDMNVLSGRSLYIYAIARDGEPSLVNGQPSVSVNQTTRSATVTLTSAKPVSCPGTYAGNIVVRVCLDQLCETEVANSGRVVPYNITVKPGVALGNHTVALNSPFGTMPESVTVPVTLAPEVTSWEVGSFNSDGRVKVSKAGDGSNNIVVSAPKMLAPGTTATDPYVSISATIGGQRLSQPLEVSYSSLASSVKYSLVQPNGAYFVVKQNYPYMAPEQDLSVIVPADSGNLSGTSIESRTTEYLSWPAAANNYPYRNGSNQPLNAGWLYAGISYGPYNIGAHYRGSATVQACYGGPCLPVGRYTARVPIRYRDPAGSTTLFYYPVTMDIVP